MLRKILKRSLLALLAGVSLLLFFACQPYDPTKTGTDITADSFPILLLDKAGIVIDGETGDWPAVIPAVVESDSQVVIGSREEGEYYSAVMQFVFDKDNFYLSADIIDDTPFANKQKKDLIWQGDCLEIYLGFHDEAHPAMEPNDFQLGIALVEQDQTVWNWPKKVEVQKQEVRIKKSEKGLKLEAKIPLTNFGILSLKPGDPVWIDFGIDNSTKISGNRSGQMIWYGNANDYKNPNFWQKAVLINDFNAFKNPVVTGSALFRLDQNYKANIFYKGKPWQGSVMVNSEKKESDERGGITFLIKELKEEKNVLISLQVDNSIYYKRIFISDKAKKEYLDSLSKGKQAELPPVPADAVYKDPKRPIAERVENLMSYMSLQEKIGQMTQIDRKFIQDMEDLAAFGIGSLLSGGGSAPASNTPEEWLKMYNTYQQAALKSRLSIPLIYGIDAVHGHNNVKGATIFPHHIGLGATGDAELVERAARIVALEVSATGIDWTFAPCIAVPRDERWGRTYEGFSEDPELTALLGAAEVRGFQGLDLDDPTTILATAKHFAGDGGTQGGKDRGDVLLDEKTFLAVFVKPYEESITAGVGSIMISFSSWNGQKMHGNKYLITDILKKKMGFEGFIVSDWAAVYQLPGSTKEQIAAAINAGIDMVMVPDDYLQFINLLAELVEENKVPLERIDEAVRKILTAKLKLGLFEAPLADGSLLAKVGCQEHREVAREAVRKSLVLLKNNRLLPLAKELKHIHIAGALAKDLGAQCGGWTIEWQGNNGNITTGTTIYEAVIKAVSPATKVTFSGDAGNPGDADVIIAVVGEEVPYAEMQGDREDLSLSPYSKSIIANAKKTKIPLVVVLISGRPLIITEEIEMADAFVAAWLPGTEAQGIADVLFGDYKPSGKLSFTWPRSNSQIPINKGDGKINPLFPFGFGLTY
jgi:beta-glucosidase